MQIISQILLSILLGLGISAFLVPVIVRMVRKLKLLEQPNLRSSNVKPIPALGGIAIYFGFLFSTTFGSISYELPEMIYILSASTLMLFIGLKDDLVTLSPIKKITGQLIAAGILIFMAKIRFTNLHGLFGFFEIGVIPGILITGFLIVLLINAFNLMDGIDGLAAGLSILFTLIFGIWFYLSGHIGYAILAFSLMGAISGFFYYNVYGKENKIFMGDTGSLFLGTVISVLLIQFNEFNIDPTRPFAIESAPAISFGILAYPLIDTMRVMAIRILQNKSPFSADKNHLHHRLLTLGFKHDKATYTIIGLNLLFMGVVFALHHLGVLRLMVYIIVSCTIIFMIPAFFIKKRKLIRKNDPMQQLLLPGSSDEIFKNRRQNSRSRKKKNDGDLLRKEALSQKFNLW